MFKEYFEKKTGMQLRDAQKRDVYECLLEFVGERSADRGYNMGKKKLYYVSAEFLIGRLMETNLINLGIYKELREILTEYGRDLSHIAELEMEPSLGNGGFY